MSQHDYQALTTELNSKLAEFRKEIPETMKGFGQLAQAGLAEGALTAKEKELIALAIGIAARCQGCLGFHAKALVKLGCTRKELMEMLSIAVYMGGGPSLMTAAEAVLAYETFGGEKAAS
ncbi:MAG: carboxymuconolactone decarboxylase family protein [Neisseriaceae bacterium]|nr:carboxymuconolactone decarboxylase family protein [Neisseriaceae bacterium]MBQ9619114.1 carboxymuconolactone decarboxylase family protein [Neisseriaceae bacterium]